MHSPLKDNSIWRVAIKKEESTYIEGQIWVTNKSLMIKNPIQKYIFSCKPNFPTGLSTNSNYF